MLLHYQSKISGSVIRHQVYLFHYWVIVLHYQAVIKLSGVLLHYQAVNILTGDFYIIRPITLFRRSQYNQVGVVYFTPVCLATKFRVVVTMGGIGSGARRRH